MTDARIAKLDTGEANNRILNKEEYKADFRRVEAASLKRKIRLSSPHAKRLFLRCFYSFQASVYFIGQIGRTKLDHAIVEAVEQDIRSAIEASTKEINQGIDGAELLLKNNNVEDVATYETVPLETEISVTSALGRRYLELINKLDLVMPMLETLCIEEVITEREAERQRSRYKRITLNISSKARNLWFGIRRRMNMVDAVKDEEVLAHAFIPVSTSQDVPGSPVPAHLGAEVGEVAGGVGDVGDSGMNAAVAPVDPAVVARAVEGVAAP
jgi:hypothetical protein